MGSLAHSFTALRGGATSTHATIGGIIAPGTIRRRIYTTNRNGVFISERAPDVADRRQPDDRELHAAPVRSRLWPPDPTVDPPSTTGCVAPTGILDDELGFMSLSLAQLKTEFAGLHGQRRSRSCTWTAAPRPRPRCSSGRARKEARQIILAHAAGADLVKNGTSRGAQHDHVRAAVPEAAPG